MSSSTATANVISASVLLLPGTVVRLPAPAFSMMITVQEHNSLLDVVYWNCIVDSKLLVDTPCSRYGLGLLLPIVGCSDDWLTTVPSYSTLEIILHLNLTPDHPSSHLAHSHLSSSSSSHFIFLCELVTSRFIIRSAFLSLLVIPLRLGVQESLEWFSSSLTFRLSSF